MFSFLWRPAVPVAVLLLFLTLSGCDSNVVGPDGTDPPGETVSFSADIQPLLAAQCSPCHVGRTTSGVNLTTHADVRASVGTQYGEAVVRADDAAGSALVDKIEASPRFGSRMPLGRTPLTSEEIAQVRAWIDAGALDN